MTIEILSSILGWATIINLSIITLWFCVFTFYHDTVFRLHSKWFKLSEEKFDTIHYAGMAFYKLATYLFNLVPYLAIKIVI
ncbi:MAG: hypothetical protein PHQ03_01330 [Methylococcales bacterium]|nr:hypothetical protein [Methylococcales bacterium]